MGCTSSAPNMATSLTNSEKDLKLSEETCEMNMGQKEIIKEIENDSNGIQVLPTCDTLGDSSHLDRNNKSSTTISSLDIEKVSDSHANGHIVESENENNISQESDHSIIDIGEKTQSEEKLSTLTQVVEKVVELYVDNNTLTNTQSETIINKDLKVKVEEEKDEADEKLQDEKEVNCAEKAEAEEAASPSQSQCSRATRWEALADIAAELPPSLAFDPVTGQIYLLSK